MRRGDGGAVLYAIGAGCLTGNPCGGPYGMRGGLARRYVSSRCAEVDPAWPPQVLRPGRTVRQDRVTFGPSAHGASRYAFMIVSRTVLPPLSFRSTRKDTALAVAGCFTVTERAPWGLVVTVSGFQVRPPS